MWYHLTVMVLVQNKFTALSVAFSTLHYINILISRPSSQPVAGTNFDPETGQLAGRKSQKKNAKQEKGGD
jgi:hypothetical protein